MDHYMQSLSDDEILEVCRIITAKKLREDFSQEPSLFNALMPGFRPNALTDEQAYTFIVKNRNNDFAQYVFKSNVNAILNTLAGKMRELREKGMTQKDALIETLAHSPFFRNVGLLYKLKGGAPSPEEINAISYEVRLFIIDKEHSRKISALQEQYRQEEAKHEELLSSLHTANTETQELLSHVEQAIHELQAAQTEHEQFGGVIQEVIDTQQEIITSLKNAGSSHLQEASCYFSEGEDLSNDDTEIYSSWQELLSIAESELEQAGTAESSCRPLAHFLYSAYTRKIPILLAGPSGAHIANAFSAALSSRLPAVLHCEGNFSRKALEQVAASSSEIIVIENIFAREWYQHIVSMLSMREKFYVAVHPFPEDLKLEPASLMNYCLPVLTETVIDHHADTNYIGGRKSASFTEFHGSSSAERIYSNMVKQLTSSQLTRKTIWGVMSDMQAMGSTELQELFLIYSLAYVSGKVTQLIDSTTDTAALKILRSFYGEDI